MASTYNLFINSKNRNNSEKSNNFSLQLQNQIMVHKPNQYISVNVMSFYMLNSMYNISTILDNNTFDLERRTLAGAFDSITKYTIGDGNYSVLTLRDFLNTQLSGKVSIVYNYQSNTYTFTKTDTTYRYYIKNIKCSKQIGISETTEITALGIKGSYVNMVDYQQIILKTDLQYEALNQDNITDADDQLNVSQILFWANKQDVEPFKTIQYQNFDGGNSFSYNIVNENITKINFELVNENNEPIIDAPEWLLHLSFTVNDKPEFTMYELAKKILKLISETNYVLLNILFKR